MKKIMAIIEAYGMIMDPDQDINTTEALTIIHESKSRMELIENCFTYGYFKGSSGNASDGTRKIPIYNLKQMTDDEWNELAARNKAK